MLDVKAWMETAGEPVADTAFPPGDAPPMPYIAFLDTVHRGGGDMQNSLHTHDLTVERYSDTADYNTALEALFDAQAIKYTRERQWMPDPDGFFMTIYTFSLIERG